MDNKKIRRLNSIKQMLNNIVYIGFASPSKYKELNEVLGYLFELENDIKEENQTILKEINFVKKQLKDKIEKEDKKHKWIKRSIKAYLFHWIIKKDD